MIVHSVYDKEFRAYGQVLTGFDARELLAAMKAIPLPETGTAYRPWIEALEACGIFPLLRDRAFGGLPMQLGMCWGRNTRLNCLEYHKCSEINLGAEDFLLLLALREEIENWRLDTAKVKAFRVPAGVPVELYAATLHFAPCHLDPETGFRVAVALPRGTNTDRPEILPACPEDRLLRARNKWLLAHPDSPQAQSGAYVGLVGENLDTAGLR